MFLFMEYSECFIIYVEYNKYDTNSVKIQFRLKCQRDVFIYTRIYKTALWRDGKSMVKCCKAVNSATTKWSKHSSFRILDYVRL